VYLDSAATTLKPEPVVEAVVRHYTRESANIHRGVHQLSETATADYEEARETVRAFLNAKSVREVVFTAGTTDSINLVARSFGDAFIGPGDEVLITTMEHHANIVPWQQLCERTGAELKAIVMDPDGNLDMTSLSRKLSDRTKLVAATAVSNAIGTVNPVRKLAAAAHAVGARFLVDAAQAVAVQPVDVQEWNCDFLAFSGHKIFGPTGVGVLYAREDVLETMPPFRGGGDMILSVTVERSTYNDLPYRFEAGTPHIAGAIGLAAALRYVARIGFDRIQSHEADLLQYATDSLNALRGVSIVGQPALRTAILPFVVDGIHPHDVGTLLDGEGVAVRAGHHCAQPAVEHFGLKATVRASFSIYNDRSDVDRLADAVRKTQGVFA
jgi:cysteine desulfurase/selenocysteine lyase